MKIFAAYAIVFFVNQLILTISVIVVGLIFGFLLLFLPEKVRSFVSAFLGGMAGLIFAILFAKWIFHVLGGIHAFKIFPYVFCILALLIPIRNDFKKYKQMKHASVEIKSLPSDLIVNSVAPTIIAAKAVVMGEIAGVIVTIIWFVIYNK